MSSGAPGHPLESSPPALPSRLRQVLVVDPEDAFRRKGCRVFQSLGHQSYGVRDAREALRTLSRQPTDLIVLDLGLPGRGGEELFKAIREDDETFHIPFLFLGRGAHPHELIRGIPLEPAVLLRKPYTFSRFRETILPLLRRLDRIDAFGAAPGFEGSLGELDLYDLLGLIERYERSGRLTLWPTDRKSSVTASFVDGRLVEAAYGSMQGRDVLMELMLWPDGYYRFQPFATDAAEIVDRISEEAWEELAGFLHLVDRGRVNPFPMSRQRRVGTAGPVYVTAPSLSSPTPEREAYASAATATHQAVKAGPPSNGAPAGQASATTGIHQSVRLTPQPNSAPASYASAATATHRSVTASLPPNGQATATGSHRSIPSSPVTTTGSHRSVPANSASSVTSSGQHRSVEAKATRVVSHGRESSITLLEEASHGGESSITLLEEASHGGESSITLLEEASHGGESSITLLEEASHGGESSFSSLETSHAGEPSYEVLETSYSREPSFVTLAEGARGDRPARPAKAVSHTRESSITVLEEGTSHAGEPSLTSWLEEEPGARDGRFHEEPLADGPPPPRGDDEEQDLDVLITDAWTDVTDPFISRPSEPVPMEGMSEELLARNERASVLEPAGPIRTGAERLEPSRTEVIARVLGRHPPPPVEPGIDALLRDSRDRIRGVLQIEGRDGRLLTTTAGDEVTRRQLAEMAKSLRLVYANTARDVGDAVEHVAVEFQGGHLLLMDLKGKAWLVCFAPTDTRLGSLIVECQRLSEQLAPALHDTLVRSA